MLFARRRRLEAMEKAEAAGESFWATYFDQSARMKLVHAFNDACIEPLQESTRMLPVGWSCEMKALPTSATAG
jgi:hypothetical protein